MGVTEISAVLVAFALTCSIIALAVSAGVTKQKAAAASVSAHEAHQRIDRLTETSATSADIAAAERRFADAVTGIRSDVQHMTGRLDQLLSGMAARPPQ